MKETNMINRKNAHLSIWEMIVCIFFLICSTSIAIAQVRQKKHLSENEYYKWGDLRVTTVSGTGSWVSYKMSYENNTDTLFVKSTVGNKIYSFPNGNNGIFLNADIFTCMMPDQKLYIVDLNSGTKVKVNDVSRFEVAYNGKYIITLNQTYGLKSNMQIRDENGEILDHINGVSEYILNSKADALVYSSEVSGNQNVGLIDLKKYARHTVISAKQHRFHMLTWQNNGDAIAFFNETDSITKNNKLYLYQLSKRKILQLIQHDFKEIAELNLVKDLGLKISDDGSKVFFGIKKRELSSSVKENEVEIWNGNAPFVYPLEKKIGNFQDSSKLAVWFLESNSCLPISSNELPYVKLTGKQDYALLSNPKSYAPHYKQDGDVDYYITNLRDNTLSFFLKQQPTDHNDLIFSPLTNQIAYYRDDNWWLYNPDKNKRVNLTSGIETVWDSRNDALMPPISPYNCPGWSSDGKYLLLYDTYDLWIADLTQNTCRRITHGREKNIVFRISQFEFSNIFSAKYDGKSTAVFDLSKDLILEATDKDDCSTGYFIWNARKGEKPLAFNDSAINQVRRSKNGYYFFIEQKFDKSPVLLFKPNKSAKSTEVFASNPQQEQYNWGKSELIHYTNKKGQELKGVLLYPSDYDKEKKYPMVVYIYQTKSVTLHEYTNPSQYSEEGFNPTNYTLNGYFVLLPDIVYELGDPGPSATDCVVAAVKKVIDFGFVDPEKIGLIGHSFGAYEANFIITQTDIFAAAISGAGISDTVLWYFSMGKDLEIPQAWRLENQQLRMGKSFYEDQQSYFRNSPLMNAENIKTPLLQWTGKEDTNICWEQSEAFYIALRRLGKEHMMLVYPDESHAIYKKDNQKDLTIRIQQWFNHYLKKRPSASWISVGTKAQ
ncbi:S9 family peptidase [Flavobacterium chilense]|uniref:Dipeptidyl aminopeptidase/acylaminoacyl peptidase n=1 Tax=Flavobacterium chilense TaxID=946677 RepID=A0A1M7AKG7_9FLAO|nr:prolyl oligopeptidase family serine peptidase [Flavobacterium chilense]SHL43263.1 Dipeptidyl aminopeptidase/acylaminoacyl peptidase [Flavobacterium chilense]